MFFHSVEKSFKQLQTFLNTNNINEAFQSDCESHHYFLKFLVIFSCSQIQGILPLKVLTPCFSYMWSDWTLYIRYITKVGLRGLTGFRFYATNLCFMLIKSKSRKRMPGVLCAWEWVMNSVGFSYRWVWHLFQRVTAVNSRRNCRRICSFWGAMLVLKNNCS